MYDHNDRLMCDGGSYNVKDELLI